jgi:TonB family protein
MTRKPSRLRRNSLIASLAMHGAALLLILLAPLFGKGCAFRKPKPKPIFVEFTVALPPPEPAPTEPTPTPAPEPPPPPPKDEIPEPAPKKPDPPKEAPKPPEPPKPKPPKVIKQTNRVVRAGTSAPPPPKGPQLSAKEIEKLLKQGAKIGDVTSIPDDAAGRELGAYRNRVRDRLYAAWQQPDSLRNLPGVTATVEITIQQNGTIGGSRLLRSSGNADMDASVQQAVRTAKSMPPLPSSVNGPIPLEIEFEVSR